MSWARFGALMKTTTARLSALYLILFTICAVALVFYMTSLATGFLARQTQDLINSEVSDLRIAYDRGGMTNLIRMLDRRSRQPGASLYLIADRQGRILAGNVRDLERGVLDRWGWTSRAFEYERFGVSAREGNRQQHRAVARVTELPNGLIMLVGNDLGEPERFRGVVRDALIFALGLMALGGLAIWFFVGRHAMKRIDAVSEAGQRIMAGDLTQRLPVSGAGDEFDRLSDNLNTMLARISELNEGVRQVSGNIAHDLKTPLTRLRSRAEAALTGEKSVGDLRNALEQAISDSDGLMKTFNAILMISRLESGYSTEAMETVDIAAVIRDVFELYEPVAEEKEAELLLAPLDSTLIQANRELVAQALANLIDNALKYAGRNGATPLKITGRLTADARTVTVDICDNGPGIALEDRERVTERLVRLEESRTMPGSGLGLSLVKAVMKLHRGKLTLNDAEPGLCARLQFPRSTKDTIQ